MQFIDSQLLMSEQDVKQAIEYFLRMKVFVSSKIPMSVEASIAIVTLSAPPIDALANQTEGKSE